jgi:hypothetical protein
MVRENELERQIQLAKQSAVESNQMFQARIYDLQMEKSALEQQHNTLIRKQHLASIRQMESARWLPEDETKIMSDLSKLKMDMRSWAKTSSIKDASILQTLGEVEHTALMQELSNVVVLEHGQLPMGITTTAKWPMILLNALLTDHVYMSIFQSPFFFLGTNSENSSSTFRPEGTVEDMYSRAQNCRLVQTACIYLANCSSKFTRCSYMAFSNVETSQAPTAKRHIRRRKKVAPRHGENNRKSGTTAGYGFPS